MSLERAGRESGANGSHDGASREGKTPGKQTQVEGEQDDDAAQPVPSLTLGRGATVGRGATATTPTPTGGPAAPTAGAIRVTNWNTARSNPSMSRTRVGVGEMVELSAAGRGTWAASRQHSGDMVGGGGARSKFMWRAPAEPGAATITFTPTGGAAVTQAMEVVAPSAVNFVRPRATPMARAGVAMVNDVEIGPGDVAFDGAQWKEEAGASAAPRAVQGYFQRYRATGGDLNHHPNPDWLTMDSSMNDTAGVGGLPPLEGGLWSDGTFHWDIPNRYTVEGRGDGHVFATVQQAFRISQDGSVTVTKGGQSITGTPGPRGTASTSTPTELAEYRRAREGEGLELLLDRLRDAPDEATRAEIRGVLERRSPGPKVRISVKCTNSYSWVEDDAVTVTVNSRPLSRGAFTIDTGGEEIAGTIDFFELHALRSLQGASRVPGLDINVHVEGHNLRKRVDHVFVDTGFERVGSDGRYEVKYELVNRGGTGGGAFAGATATGAVAPTTP